jgi:hypothetical protein
MITEQSIHAVSIAIFIAVFFSHSTRGTWRRHGPFRGTSSIPPTVFLSVFPLDSLTCDTVGGKYKHIFF